MKFLLQQRTLFVHLASLVVIFILSSGSSASYAQSAEHVVYSIKGDIVDLALGQMLKAGDRIKLPPETEVRLLSESGEFTLLKGPLSITISNEESDDIGEAALSTLSRLLFEEERFVPVLAGSRSLGKQTDISTFFKDEPSSDPWSPVLSHYSDYCLQLDLPVLWRNEGRGNLTVHVNAGRAGKIEILWPTNSRALHLDDYLDPSQVEVTATINTRLKPIYIHLLDTLGTTKFEQAAWLAERNCLYQALQILAMQAPSKVIRPVGK